MYDCLYFVGFSGVWKGSLDLSHAPITHLPDNLKVGGTLDLRSTPITHLPDNLVIGRYLHLSGTHITQLPDNLKVDGDLYLRYTDINGDGFIKPVGVKGDVWF